MKPSRFPNEAGKHGFYAPLNYETQLVQTFSVGVFEMIPTKSGEKLKKSKARVRVHGHRSQYDLVIQKAHEVADQLDTGTYTGKGAFWV